MVNGIIKKHSLCPLWQYQVNTFRCFKWHWWDLKLVFGAKAQCSRVPRSFGSLDRRVPGTTGSHTKVLNLSSAPCLLNKSPGIHLEECQHVQYVQVYQIDQTFVRWGIPVFPVQLSAWRWCQGVSSAMLSEGLQLASSAFVFFRSGGSGMSQLEFSSVRWPDIPDKHQTCVLALKLTVTAMIAASVLSTLYIMTILTCKTDIVLSI